MISVTELAFETFMHYDQCITCINCIVYEFFQVPGKSHCMSASSDGKFVFVGTSTSLVVIEAVSNTVKDSWEDDVMDIASLNVAVMDDDVYLLSIINDLG